MMTFADSTMIFKREKIAVLIEHFLLVPWYVSLLLGEAAFALCKWVLPVMCSTHTFLRPVEAASPSMAWPVAIVFMLLAGAIFVAQKSQWLSPILAVPLKGRGYD